MEVWHASIPVEMHKCVHDAALNTLRVENSCREKFIEGVMIDDKWKFKKGLENRNSVVRGHRGGRNAFPARLVPAYITYALCCRHGRLLPCGTHGLALGRGA